MADDGARRRPGSYEFTIFNQNKSIMKETPGQADLLLLDWAKRMGANPESSEKLETQLKTLLIQQSREHLPDDVVARTAKALAACLRGRGDREQAEQYGMMAANLERWHGGAREGGDWRSLSQIDRPAAGSSLWQESPAGARATRNSLAQSLKLLLKSFRGQG